MIMSEGIFKGFNKIRIIDTCHNRTERYLGCHDHCERYKAAKEKYLEQTRIIKKTKNDSLILYRHKIERMQKDERR